MGTSIENGISVFFFVFLENNADIFYVKMQFPLFRLVTRFFFVFSGLVVGTSFENGISVIFLFLLENNATIFYLKPDFPFFGLVMGTSGK